MSLPDDMGQGSFFQVDSLWSSLFAGPGPDPYGSPGAGRFVFFAREIWPRLAAKRPLLATMYCVDNGRPAEEPVRMLAVSILQFMERLPDRLAVEACEFDLRWKLALHREVDAKAFHPTGLSHFRQRLLEHGLERVAFEGVLDFLRERGYLSRRSKQRLDSTHILGLVSRMSRLDCVRETLRLALKELEGMEGPVRPEAWATWIERYVESQVDYKSSEEVLRAKMTQAGEDARDLLAWVATWGPEVRPGKQVELLGRVFAENFEVTAAGTVEKRRAQPTGAVHNPHNPDAQWSAKSATDKKKEWVGHKVQVAETVEDAPRAKGEPTRAVLTSIVTQAATESDKAGMAQTREEQRTLDLAPPSVLYTDGAYVSGPALHEAKEEGRELMGPAPASPKQGGRFRTEDFTVDVEHRWATCPAGKESTQCSRLEEGATGQVSFRFEWSTACRDCLLRASCVAADQPHRTLTVGEHHTLLQARREFMKTPAFPEEMKHRNAIEGTQSELVRGYGLRKARYRGSAKVRLQNYLIGAAGNIKRVYRRTVWEAKHCARTRAGRVLCAPETAANA